MALSENEINAEKADKPRPDLLPARAILGVMQAMPYVCELPNERELYAHALTALKQWQIDRHARDTTSVLPVLYHCAAAIARLLFVLEGPTEQEYARVGSMIPGVALHGGGVVMAYGLRKMGGCTWRNAGQEQAKPETHAASLERHLVDWWRNPYRLDAGSQSPQLWHAFAQACIVIDLEENPPQPIEQLERRAMRVPLDQRMRATAPTEDEI